jgi:PhzF family phenazine biosynthesis protein
MPAVTDYAFRLVNVFAEAPLAGNPLCVFEDARGLDEQTMQALALQFNLSETTFVLPSTRATARVRIFTPTFEMAFAGHPTLGTAHVVRDIAKAGDRLVLEMKAGLIAVEARGDVWTLDANAPRHRRPDATRDELASALGLAAQDVGENPLWVDTGSEQLIVPLRSADAVRRAMPDAALMQRHASNGQRSMAYVFARDGDRVLSRFFFP